MDLNSFSAAVDCMGDDFDMTAVMEDSVLTDPTTFIDEDPVEAVRTAATGETLTAQLSREQWLNQDATELCEAGGTDKLFIQAVVMEGDVPAGAKFAEELPRTRRREPLDWNTVGGSSRPTVEGVGLLASLRGPGHSFVSGTPFRCGKRR